MRRCLARRLPEPCSPSASTVVRRVNGRDTRRGQDTRAALANLPLRRSKKVRRRPIPLPHLPHALFAASQSVALGCCISCSGPIKNSEMPNCILSDGSSVSVMCHALRRAGFATCRAAAYCWGYITCRYLGDARKITHSCACQSCRAAGSPRPGCRPGGSRRWSSPRA